MLLTGMAPTALSAFSIELRPPARGGPARRRLGPPTSSISQGDALQLCSQANLMEASMSPVSPCRSTEVPSSQVTLACAD